MPAACAHCQEIDFGEDSCWQEICPVCLCAIHASCFNSRLCKQWGWKWDENTSTAYE